MRLIDADELSKWISGQSKSPSCPKNESAFGLRIIKHIDRMPSVQPDVIHCKDCKHRPKATRADEKIFYGFSVEFPDEKCPCHCEDGWYGWYPGDDFYCGYAERRAE